MSAGNGTQETVTTHVDKSGMVTATRTTRRVVQVTGTSSGFSDGAFECEKVTRTMVKRTVVRHPDGTEEVREEVVTDGGDSSLIDTTEHSKPRKSVLSSWFGKKEPKPAAIDAQPSKPAKAMSEKEFQEDSLKWHNHYRAIHGVPPLKHSNQLCKYAQEWADNLAKRDRFEHRQDHKYGENIYMAWSSDPTKEVTGREAVDSWYSEIKDHRFGGEPRSLGSGHFTQVVWKGSTELGTGRARTATGKLLVVANYNPAGNVIGSFAQNVPPPKK